MTEIDQARGGVIALIGAASLVAALASGACAAGSFSPDTSCSSDADCEGEAQCLGGICQVADTSAPPAGDTGIIPGRDTDRPVDTGSPGDPRDMDGGENPGDRDSRSRPRDGDDSGGPDGSGGDTGPPDCNDQCGVGEECDNGQCVSKCQPNCTADQQCLELGDGPQCYDKCPEAQSTEGCRGSGVLCRDLNADQNQELLVCLPSQCDTTEDCQAGTCINYVNGFGACVSDGSNNIGEACDASDPNELCENGAVCIPEGVGATGTCRELCDPWNPQCSSGGYCSLLTERTDGLSFITRRQGYCNPQTDPDGNQPFQQCRASGNMCNHAVRCLGTSDPNCVKWCRTGEGDCRGTVPSQFNARGVCHNYTFPGVRELGRCVADCGSSSVRCPDGYQCRDSLCRKTCSAGSVAQDCCAGNTPCNFECPNGFCK